MAANAAVWEMNAQKGSALRTRPSQLLSCDEELKTDLLNPEKVLYHAHAVLAAISLVELTQPSAGETGAVETRRARAAGYGVAGLDLARQTVSRLGGVIPVAAGATVLVSEMAPAQTTVHAARCDQVGSQRLG